jgi:hypothetical protein
LARKKDLELAEKSKKAAEEKAYLEKKREEDRKRVIKEKILGKDKPVSKSSFRFLMSIMCGGSD